METKYTLVTGGLGFIGSHTVVQLIESNYNVIIVDNLANSKIEVLDNIKQICQNQNCINLIYFDYDINNLENMDYVFSQYNIQNIIHFAAFKSVAESIQNPLMYYTNNINTTLNLLTLCKKYKVDKFIFSSSATVYGNQVSPLSETSKIGNNITNPYGQTKYFIEKILEDFYKSKTDTRIIILRYFNPVGAHASGLIGENPNGIPNNLMPYIIKVADNFSNNIKNKDDNNIYSTLKIYGNTYNTIDGTGVRDFIHVEDLASAHLKSIEYLNNHRDITYDVFNIGTGKGTSVLELVNTFMKVNNVVIPYEFYPKREGDLDSVFCDSIKSNALLQWKATKTIKDMCYDSYNFIVKQNM
jgi:UDP-glucose 4-epimerase